MTLRDYSDHHEPQPPNEADVIDPGEARERPRKTSIPIERLLLSDVGRAEMEWLTGTIDNSGNIIHTVAFHIGENTRRIERNEHPTIYALLLYDVGGEGLTARTELLDLYGQNPLIYATQRAVLRKHNDGDYKAKHLYSAGFRIFMNMVRYEWLTRTYDPKDPKWDDRAHRLGDYQGDMRRLHLQPGHNRGEIVPVIERKYSPSDYLEPLT